ncbi:MAG: hypothetical protein HY774_14545 [Acidobacteria bacterium]|nr:hypothetical protein [Acidobacteriota bacterium]
MQKSQFVPWVHLTNFFLMVSTLGSFLLLSYIAIQPIHCGGPPIEYRVAAFVSRKDKRCSFKVNLEGKFVQLNDGPAVCLESLIAHIRPALITHPKPERNVVIVTSRETAYQQVIDLVDQLKKAGATTIDLALAENQVESRRQVKSCW